MNKEYLSVKEFAAAAEVSSQYIYKILDTKLKPYKRKIDKKTFISSSAVVLIKGATDETNLETNRDNQTEASEINTLQEPQTAQNSTPQPTLQQNQPTNATNFATGEIEALKQLIEELKRDKEDLKKDKEDLKQEAIKWQQLLIEEKNKVKLLEATASKTEEAEESTVVEFEEVNNSKEEKREPLPAEPPNGFINKLKWLFSN